MTPPKPKTRYKTPVLSVVPRPEDDPHQIPPSWWIEEPPRYVVFESDQYNILAKPDMLLRLRAAGLQSKKLDEDKLTEVESELLRIQTSSKIHAVSPVPGYPPGVHRFGTRDVLVQTGPALIEPKAGDFAFIEMMVNDVLGTGLQSDLFHGWLANRLRTIVGSGATAFTGQLLGIVGPANCGKSRLQHDIISPVLGSGGPDSAAPNYFDHASGADKFTDDLMLHAHWCAEDVTDRIVRDSDREKLASGLKEMVHSNTQRWRPMYGKPFTTPKRFGLTLSLNSENDEVKVLPASVLHGGMADKFLLLSAQRNSFPFPDTGTPPLLKQYRDEIRTALPGYVHFLLHEYNPPRGYEHRRSLIKGYCHPDIQRQIIRDDFWEVVDKIRGFEYFEDGRWEGTVEQFHSCFGLSSAWLDKRGRTKVGNVLPTVAAMHPGAVEKAPRTAAARGWIVRPIPPTP